MKLDEIKQPYDLVISLGGHCEPSYQIERLKLRRFSGPLDWMISHSLSHISLLIRKNFSDFMDFSNLSLVETEPGSPYYTVRDAINNCVSVHDFPIDKTLQESYSDVKSKLDRRANRFLQEINNSKSILFVRVMGDYKDVIDLHSSLSEKTKSNFNILLINHYEGNKISELDWGLNNICSINIPNELTRWQGNDACWDEILKGVTLVSK
ncbi:DUF1796 family putative cysteine peptidase [Metabacillus fastidiosus]|uniref:DUF1796 family putative cysteine peptidase n=1 Tax=Metabacillus fastidiosus TaxID=1458 RepID=UPI003D279FFC